MMYKQMKKTVPKSDLFEQSAGREIFEEMLDEELMDDATQRGVGVAEVLYKQLSLNLDNMYEISDEDNLHSQDATINDEYKANSKDMTNSTERLK